MTSKDKTRDKLVASMRKTKAGAEAKNATQDAEVATAPSKTVASPRNVLQTSSHTAQKANSDPYQSGPRVWPD